VPHRSLIPKGIDNLLVSGRAISATRDAFASVRVMGTSLGIGEACGTAAAMSAERNAAVSEFDGREVHGRMESSGILLM
jgi:hypothetical protein